jgi:hypothetical protein
MTANQPIESLSSAGGITSKRLAHFGVLLVSSVLTFIVAELVELNRFLRTVIQGQFFWAYTIVFVFTFVLLFAFSLLWFRGGQSQPTSFKRLFLPGTIVGFVSSLLGISLSPVLVSGGMSPGISAWKDSAHLFVAGVISLGWLSGALTAYIYHLIISNRWRKLTILFAICVGIRGMELVTHLVLSEKRW